MKSFTLELKPLNDPVLYGTFLGNNLKINAVFLLLWNTKLRVFAQRHPDDDAFFPGFLTTDINLA